MHSNIRERRAEGGFTLIELLVVMIIIAILMAVAVPTFLAQKNTAQKTKATSNIKQIVNAIESCATNNTDSTYTDATNGGANDCTNPTVLKGYEKGLTSLDIVDGPPTLTSYSVRNVGTQGYSVQAWITDGEHSIRFAENHLEDGTLAKLCDDANIAINAATMSGGVAESRTCPSGTW